MGWFAPYMHPVDMLGLPHIYRRNDARQASLKLPRCQQVVARCPSHGASMPVRSARNIRSPAACRAHRHLSDESCG
jgi:hypothetical protein